MVKLAQYLLRFDDLCPTMDRGRFDRFLPMIREFGIRPLLAIVPDNQDPDLICHAPDPGFWTRMRDLEAAGATIGVHGYQHLCRSSGKSLIPMHRITEFAGRSLDTQRRWIEHGIEILRWEGLTPRIWVAPRHGFDRNTLEALRMHGIELLSDGFARAPYRRDGLIWIPQQLWLPVEKSRGLWTICIHSNTVHESFPQQVHGFVQKHAAQFTSVDRIVAELSPGTLGKWERIHETVALWRAVHRWHESGDL